MKKKDIKSILLVSLIIFLLVILMPMIVFNPAIDDVFNFNELSKSNVSSVINNLITPIISFFSVILLYITLNKQIDSMYDQRRSKNLDLILSFYNQLENEYSSFTYIERRSGNSRDPRITETTYFGFEALFNSMEVIQREPSKFGKTYHSDKMVGLIYTYDLILTVMYALDIEDKIKYTLEYKLDNFYAIKMKSIFLHVAFLIRDFDNENSKAIVKFVQEREKKYNKDFDIYTFKSESDIFGG